MNYRNIEEFARWLTSDESGVDWYRALMAYRWRGTDWFCGVRTRLRFHGEMVELRRLGKDRAVAPPGFADLAREIAHDWGGVKALSADELPRVWQGLACLEDVAVSEDGAVERLYFGTQHVAIAKIYAMSDPDQWLLYDSRVAFALQELVLQRYTEAVPESLAFCLPRGRTARSPPDVRVGMVNTHNQFRDGFLCGSSLVQAIAGMLRYGGGQQPDAVPLGRAGKSDGRWRAYHVEMALFTLGANAVDTDTEVSATAP